MEIINIIVLGLATWRIAYMLNEEHGPLDIFIEFRKLVGIEEFYKVDAQRQMEILEKLRLPSGEEPPEYYAESFIGKLVACLNCLSVWVGLFVFITSFFLMWLYYILAVSTIAIIIDNYNQGE